MEKKTKPSKIQLRYRDDGQGQVEKDGVVIFVGSQHACEIVARSKLLPESTEMSESCYHWMTC